MDIVQFIHLASVTAWNFDHFISNKKIGFMRSAQGKTATTTQHPVYCGLTLSWTL